MIEACPFPELEFEPPKRGYVARREDLSLVHCKLKGKRGVLLFEFQEDCIRFAVDAEKDAGIRLTIRHRSWDHLCECLEGTRIRCVHVFTSKGLRTVWVK